MCSREIFLARSIKVEDVKGIHCMYGKVYLEDEVLECIDSLIYFYASE